MPSDTLQPLFPGLNVSFKSYLISGALTAASRAQVWLLPVQERVPGPNAKTLETLGDT